jgi:hypothetical protein
METIGSLLATIFVVAAILVPQIFEIGFRARRNSGSADQEFDSLQQDELPAPRQAGICGFRAG